MKKMVRKIQWRNIQLFGAVAPLYTIEIGVPLQLKNINLPYDNDDIIVSIRGSIFNKLQSLGLDLEEKILVWSSGIFYGGGICGNGGNIKMYTPYVKNTSKIPFILIKIVCGGRNDYSKLLEYFNILNGKSETWW